MVEYQVIDLRGDLIAPATMTVEASSPEKAAEAALGICLVRSGARRDLKARVYWQTNGQPKNMVRLYSQVAEQRQR